MSIFHIRSCNTTRRTGFQGLDVWGKMPILINARHEYLSFGHKTVSQRANMQKP